MRLPSPTAAKAHQTDSKKPGATRASLPANGKLARHLGRHLVKHNLQGLVITVAGTAVVVAGMFDGAARRLHLVVEDEVAVGAHLAVFSQQKGAGIKIKIGAAGGSCVPTQPNQNLLQIRRGLGQRDGLRPCSA